jgi:hypothetical protein
MKTTCAKKRAPGGIDGRLDLKGLQTLLHRLIVAPEGVEEGLAAGNELLPHGLAGIINGDDRLSPGERLAIYANAYFYRLLDVFKEEFPATLSVVGDVSFHNLITSYLNEFPPVEPSILHAGRCLPDYIRAHPFSERWPYLADLARLERADLEIFHARTAPALNVATLRGVLPDDWPKLILQMHPAARILDLKWRVDTVLRAVEKNEAPIEPVPGQTRVLVWRRGSQTHYRALERVEGAALTLTRDGASFATICEAVAMEADPGENTEKLINALVVRWLDDGVLTYPSPGSAPPGDAAS